MNTKLILLLLLSFLWSTGTSGQSRKRSKPLKSHEIFEAGALLGVNISQLDGDYFTGFDKAGWYGGLRGIVNLSYRTSINMELLFSQKGSTIPHGVRLDARQEIRDRQIALNYAEVPFLLKYKFNPNPKSPFLEIGGVYSRLIGTKITEKDPQNINGTIYQDIVPEFRTSEISFSTGIGINPIKNVELSVRYTYAFNRLYINEDFELPPPFSRETKEVEFLRNYHLTVLVAYKFFSTIK